jgi:predicted enzyme related to lactoylglutathione lyase
MHPILALLLLSRLLPAPEEPRPAAEPPVRVTGVEAVRVDVADLEAAVAFYRDRLGFQQVSAERSDGSVRLESAGVPLVLRRVPEPAPAAEQPSRCHARFNLHADDLDGTVARLEAEGVRFGAEHESQISRVRSFHDPAGNPLNLKGLFEPRDTGGAIRPFNVGIEVADMARAEAFYAGVLGLDVLTRDYYPPVVPFEKRGALGFILSEAASADAAPGYGRTPRVLLRFATDELDAALAALHAGGVRLFEPEPRDGPDGRWIAFADPFGNVHELLEPRPRGAGDGGTGVQALGWLAGTWRLEEGDALLEESWSAPAGDSLVGAFRWQRGGTTTLYELMTIEAEDGELVFRLHHFSRGMRLWEREAREGPLAYPAVRIGSNEAVFERADRDDPRRFVYRRLGDELTIRLEGEAGVVDEFRLQRWDAGR